MSKPAPIPNIKWFCFVTEDGIYQKAAADARKSFAQFGIEIHIETMPAGIDWMATCMQRPALLRDKLTSLKAPVGMIDADLLARSLPSEMVAFVGGGEFPFDILVRDMGQGSPDAAKYLAGLVAFNYTQKGVNCVSDWAARCKRDYNPKCGLREQFYLHAAIDWAQGNIKRLKPEYNCIPDQNGNYPVTNPIVTHDFREKQKNGYGTFVAPSVPPSVWMPEGAATKSEGQIISNPPEQEKAPDNKVKPPKIRK